MIIILLFITLVLLIIVHWIRILTECKIMNINGPMPLPIVGNAHLFLVKSTECKIMNINGPMPLPIVGNAHLFLVKSTELLNYLQTRFLDKYGDAVRVHLFSVPAVLFCHPKYFEPLLTSMDFITKGDLYNFLTCWLGQGLLTATGHRWQTHRKFLTPAFHFNILQNFLPVFCKNQRVFINKLCTMADGKSVDIFPLVALAALDNVSESIMGVSVNAQKESESAYVKAIEEMSSIVSMRMQMPIIAKDIIFNLLPHKTRQDKALKILHNQTKKVIKARSEELKKADITSLNNIDEIGIKNKHAFLDLLLLTEIDGKKIDDKSVQEEVDTFMFEGHDTTTAGVSYTVYCLSKRRDVQDKIYEELQTIFGDNMDKDLTYSELQQMKYLEVVIKESMRLYPPVPLIQRQIVNDCKIGEFKLLKDTSVLIDIYHIQRHPDLYDDPLEFRPERFEAPLKTPFNWIPFSAGPRNCIGQKFAMMELKVMISSIVKNFVILPSDVEPQLCADLILRSKTGVHVKLVQRM